MCNVDGEFFQILKSKEKINMRVGNTQYVFTSVCNTLSRLYKPIWYLCNLVTYSRCISIFIISKSCDQFTTIFLLGSRRELKFLFLYFSLQMRIKNVPKALFTIALNRFTQKRVVRAVDFGLTIPNSDVHAKIAILIENCSTTAISRSFNIFYSSWKRCTILMIDKYETKLRIFNFHELL